MENCICLPSVEEICNYLEIYKESVWERQSCSEMKKAKIYESEKSIRSYHEHRLQVNKIHLFGVKSAGEGGGGLLDIKD